MLTGEYLLIKPSFLAQYYLMRKTGKEDELNYKSESFSEKKARVLKISSLDKDGNGVVDIIGPLSNAGPDDWDIYFDIAGTSYLNIIDSLNKLNAELDPDKKIIINMDTPGGEVNGGESVRNLMMNIRQSRDIDVKVHSLMASMGVWLGSAGTKITALNQSSMIGSIGVMINFMDFTGWYESLGIKRVIITNHESPDKWPDWNTKKGKDIIKAELDDLYDIFSAQIIEGRAGKITQEQINSLNGRVLTSQNAVNIGLIDEVEGVSFNIDTFNSDNNTAKKEKITIKSNIENPESTGNNQNNNNNGGQTIMTFEEIKAKYPDQVAQIRSEGVTAGIDQEFKRCSSYMEAMAILPEAKEIYIKAVKEKKEFNDPAVNAAIMSLMKAQKTLGEATEGNAGDIQTEKTKVKPAGKVEGEINNDKEVEAAQDVIRQQNQIEPKEVK